MTSNDLSPGTPGWVRSARAALDPYFPPDKREAFTRAVSALIMGLAASSALTPDKAVLWAQLGVSAVTLTYALLYAGTALRATVYSVLVIGASLLMAYGIADNVDWAVVVASIGQAFGVTTAAAKAQLPAPPIADTG